VNARMDGCMGVRVADGWMEAGNAWTDGWMRGEMHKGLRLGG